MVERFPPWHVGESFQSGRWQRGRPDGVAAEAQLLAERPGQVVERAARVTGSAPRVGEDGVVAVRGDDEAGVERHQLECLEVDEPGQRRVGGVEELEAAVEEELVDRVRADPTAHAVGCLEHDDVVPGLVQVDGAARVLRDRRPRSRRRGWCRALPSRSRVLLICALSIHHSRRRRSPRRRLGRICVTTLAAARPPNGLSVGNRLQTVTEGSRVGSTGGRIFPSRRSDERRGGRSGRRSPSVSVPWLRREGTSAPPRLRTPAGDLAPRRLQGRRGRGVHVAAVPALPASDAACADADPETGRSQSVGSVGVVGLVVTGAGATDGVGAGDEGEDGGGDVGEAGGGGWTSRRTP